MKKKKKPNIFTQNSKFEKFNQAKIQMNNFFIQNKLITNKFLFR